MRFVLFICLSLMASLFQAATMPVSHITDAPMENQSLVMDHAQGHCDRLLQDQSTQKNHCPDHGNHCCFGVTLQPALLLSLAIPDRQELPATLPFRLIRHIPGVLFKPPKFNPVLAG